MTAFDGEVVGSLLFESCNVSPPGVPLLFTEVSRRKVVQFFFFYLTLYNDLHCFQ